AAEIEPPRARGAGRTVEARSVVGARDPGALPGERPAGVHDGADDRLSTRSERRRAPEEEDRQRAHFRGADLGRRGAAPYRRRALGPLRGPPAAADLAPDRDGAADDGRYRGSAPRARGARQARREGVTR